MVQHGEAALGERSVGELFKKFERGESDLEYKKYCRIGRMLHKTESVLEALVSEHSSNQKISHRIKSLGLIKYFQSLCKPMISFPVYPLLTFTEQRSRSSTKLS